MPLLINSAALEVVEPIPLYELALTQRAGAPNTSSPTLTGGYYYLVRAPDQIAAYIIVNSHPTGSLLSTVGSAVSAEPMFRGLQQLSQMDQARGGNYEPRLVQVNGVRGAIPLLVFWLHSTSGRPDLFYWMRDAEFRGSTKVESEKLYTTEEFLTVARTPPVPPRYDEKWAISLASVCAKAAWPTTGNPLIYEQAVAEIGAGRPSDQGQDLGWYVYIPEREDAQLRRKHSGAIFFVDETNGACRQLSQG